MEYKLNEGALHLTRGDTVRIKCDLPLGFMRPEQITLVGDGGVFVARCVGNVENDPHRLEFHIPRAGKAVAIKVTDDSDT